MIVESYQERIENLFKLLPKSRGTMKAGKAQKIVDIYMDTLDKMRRDDNEVPIHIPAQLQYFCDTFELCMWDTLDCNGGSWDIWIHTDDICPRLYDNINSMGTVRRLYWLSNGAIDRVYITYQGEKHNG